MVLLGWVLLRHQRQMRSNLPDYRVSDAGGVRRVEVGSTDPLGCPVCGVLAMRVHSRRRQRLRDLPIAGG